ncbi:MAG: L,D-transpeptidase family protein [Nevskia sp.]|nr:L,D-transpeptidase family protein [Nevskia sp.]
MAASVSSAGHSTLRRHLRCLVLATAAAVSFVLPTFAAPSLPADLTKPEDQLLLAIDAMRDGDSGEALRQLQSLVQREPNFRLAQLLYGQVLALRSGLPGLVSPLADEQDPHVKELLDEYRARLAEAQSGPPADRLPSPILRLSPDHHYAIVADLPRSRVYVMENQNGRLRQVRDYYATIARNGYGKQNSGDLRTPVGIYRVTGFTPGGKLPPFYGAGAYPLNYPNAWDRVHGRTGSGIWLHGVPSTTYNRPPRASEGCVVLANADLTDLKALIVPGTTPVVLSDKVDWLPADTLLKEREDMVKRIETWRSKWVARNTEAYLAYYGSDFHTDDGMNKEQFTAYKRRVNEGKKHIQVQLKDLDLFTYPGEQNLILAEFTQEYRSDNFAMTTRKEQYWRREPGGEWKIVREENRTL